MTRRIRTPEQKRRAKYNAVQKKAGRPALMSNAETRQHVLTLHDEYGMALTRIAELSGTSMGVLHNIYRGVTEKVFRTTHERIMAVQPERPARRGAFMDPCGVQRRLNALTLAGFPLAWLAPIVGLAKTNLERYVQNDRTYAHSATVHTMTQVYDKYSNTRPEDHGIDPSASRVAIFYAKQRGAAPWYCWDSDTIDDPHAPPEWTGACGTIEGHRIHYREQLLPLCRNCSVAHQIYRRYPHLAQLMGVIGEVKCRD